IHTLWTPGPARLTARPTGRLQVRAYPREADESATSVTLTDLGEGQRFRGAQFVLELCVPDCAHVLNAGEHGEAAARSRAGNADRAPSRHI
ncbi:hypothetical protein ACWGNE_15720, partial [Streptomyces xiamenensis]